MVSQMDALQSFVYLTDNVPTWLSQMEELSTHTSKRHTEFAAEHSRLLRHARPKKQKTPSLISHRSGDRRSEEDRRSPRSNTSSGSHLELNPLEAGNRYLFANARKNQKNTGQSLRSGASGPPKFRQKQAVVIYYDSFVQNSFEAMVKSISTARNNLRKGKRAQALLRGPILPLTSTSFRMTGLDSLEKRSQPQSNLSPKNGREQPSTEDECFDLADKDLEAAQNYCETGAHQFLRDGDSSIEIQNTVEKLERVLELAKTTVTKFKDDHEKLRQDLEDADTAVDDTGDDGGYGLIMNFQLEKLKSAPRNGDLKVDLPDGLLRHSTPKAESGDDTVAAIEVDDEDGGDYDDIHNAFDIGRYRNMMGGGTRPAIRA